MIFGGNEPHRRPASSYIGQTPRKGPETPQKPKNLFVFLVSSSSLRLVLSPYIPPAGTPNWFWWSPLKARTLKHAPIHCIVDPWGVRGRRGGNLPDLARRAWTRSFSSGSFLGGIYSTGSYDATWTTSRSSSRSTQSGAFGANHGGVTPPGPPVEAPFSLF